MSDPRKRLGPFLIGDYIRVWGGHDGNESAWLDGKRDVRGRISAFEEATADIFRQTPAYNPMPGQTDKVMLLTLDQPHAAGVENVEGSRLILLLNDRHNIEWTHNCVVFVFLGDEGDSFTCVESHASMEVVHVNKN